MSVRVRTVSLIVCVSLALAAVGRVDAQVRTVDGRTLARSAIDSIVTGAIAAAHVPGIAIAIINDGKIVCSRGYGLRDVERTLPFNDTTVTYGASFTKAAFAYMVMQLVDEKKIALDRPVAEYLAKPLPEYAGYADLASDPRWKKVTPRMLLSHTAGFGNWRWIRPDRKLTIEFEPGTRYAYSGEGIVLMGLVAEQVTGKPLTDLMHDRVFAPLGMTRTSMVWNAAFEGDHAIGYDSVGKSLGAQKRTRANAAGSMVTTAHDWALFIAAVARGEGLSKAARDTMLSSQIRIRTRFQFPTLNQPETTRDDAIRLSYGLGWGLFWTPRGKAYFKEGHDDGWANYSVTFEDSKTAIVIVANSLNAEPVFPKLLADLIGDRWTPSVWEHWAPEANSAAH